MVGPTRPLDPWRGGRRRRPRRAHASVPLLAGRLDLAMTTTRWVPALVFSAIASGTALWLQNVLRDTWQIRTLPERVEEWLLLFVPLDLFEQGLQRLGAEI